MDMGSVVDLNPNRVLWVFQESDPYPVRYVHPLKRAGVDRLLACDYPEDVEFVILFGSSLTPQCNRSSDIDVYIVLSNAYRRDEGEGEMPPTVREIMRSIQPYGGCDILFDSLDNYLELSRTKGTVENSVMRTGMVLYARQQNG